MDRHHPTPLPRLRQTIEDGRRAPKQDGHLSALLLAHGSMELRWYVPVSNDPQTPHDRDELYIIVSGAGVFVRAEDRVQFGDDEPLSLQGEESVAVQPGDVLFVPAGTAHRFEATSPDFGTWMIFYGPEGGEA